MGLVFSLQRVNEGHHAQQARALATARRWKGCVREAGERHRLAGGHRKARSAAPIATTAAASSRSSRAPPGTQRGGRVRPGGCGAAAPQTGTTAERVFGVKPASSRAWRSQTSMRYASVSASRSLASRTASSRCVSSGSSGWSGRKRARSRASGAKRWRSGTGRRPSAPLLQRRGSISPARVQDARGRPADQGLQSRYMVSITTMQPELFRLIRMLVERILAEAFPGESAAARAQQVAVFAFVFMLQGDDQPVTSSRIAAVSGLQTGQIHKQLQKLLRLGIVERTAITSPHGRGRAWHLSIGHTPETQALADALLAGAKASAKRR